jgi:hypothetical protein
MSKPLPQRYEELLSPLMDLRVRDLIAIFVHRIGREAMVTCVGKAQEALHEADPTQHYEEGVGVTATAPEMIGTFIGEMALELRRRGKDHDGETGKVGH